MLEAARKEQQRRDELSLRLGRDPQLKESYEEAFACISTNVDTSTPRGLRIAQEVALETATDELKRHRLLQEKFKEPAFKKAYEEAREQASRAIEEANHEKTKL